MLNIHCQIIVRSLFNYSIAKKRRSNIPVHPDWKNLPKLLKDVTENLLHGRQLIDKFLDN